MNEDNTAKRFETIYSKHKGYVYLLGIDIGGEKYFKIGYTENKTKERISRLLKEDKKKNNGNISRAILLSEIMVDRPYLCEKYIHWLFREHKVGKLECAGGNEMFKPKSTIYECFKKWETMGARGVV
jgi:hypothetical protein